ncbi:transporter substrate-binding domain-containing protein [Nonomuraea sp. NPDC003804]|uniref:serine/threonine-protein kinase n=1 Tax=Nonomuraea sp. NPDC003804 TaxID=3154547 RepID=UPI0033B0DD18
MPQIAPLMAGDPSHLGSFTLSGRIGEGGQGIVYLGADNHGERAAIKLLHVKFSGDTIARSRFARELKAAQRVASFCTARVIEADLEGNTPYIASEYIDGRSLRDIVEDDGPLTGQALERLAIGTATALTAIHQASIIHRDFKPDNVLIAADGPRVVDFGIARIIDSTGTITSRAIGTPAYMAPEQIAGDDIGPYTDVFAWGATIAYAATGVTVFEGNSIAVVLNRILNHVVDVSVLPEPLRGVAAAALTKDPRERPSADEILLRLLGHPPRTAGASTAVLSQGVKIASDDTTPMARLSPATHAAPAAGTTASGGAAASHGSAASHSSVGSRGSAPHGPVTAHGSMTSQGSGTPHGPVTAHGASASGPSTVSASLPVTAFPALPGGRPPTQPPGHGPTPPTDQPAPYGGPAPVPPAKRRRSLTPWVALLAAVLLVAALAFAALQYGWPLALVSDRSPQPTPGGDSVVDRAAATGKLTIGVRADVPGVGYRDRDGGFSGFDVDVAKHIAKELRVAESGITFVAVPAPRRAEALADGDVDIVVATYSIDDSDVEFAGPYIMAHQALLVRDGDREIAKPADLKGKKLCDQRSTAVRKVQKMVDMVTVSAGNYADCIRMLAAGQVDAVAGDDLILAGFANRENARYRILGATLSDERYAVGIKKGDARTCEAIKGAISDMIARNTIGQLVATHFPHVEFKADLKVPVMESCG